MRFKDKRVLVTGGARGIGAGIAKAFADEGATVAINARSEATMAERCEKDAVSYLCVAGKIGPRDACFDMVNRAVEGLGGLDVLVANAGIFNEVPFEDVTQEEFDDNISVNLGGVFFCAQAAMPALKQSKGNIVAIASDAAIISYSASPAYCAAKGGVTSLVRALAVGYAAHPVRVNSVCPGNVETDMMRQTAAESGDAEAYLQQARGRAPARRMGTPAEIAAAVLYLASGDAGYTTGVSLPVDGGGIAGFD
ncbi:MAG: SDR family oxidoreductase [Alphaproteobacteria bacterium]